MLKIAQDWSLVISVIIFIWLCLGVYYQYQDQHSKEGFETFYPTDDNDSDLVIFIWWLYSILSLITYYLVKFPYLMLKELFQVPGRLFKQLLIAFQPLVEAIMNSIQTIQDMILELNKQFIMFYRQVWNFLARWPEEIRKILNSILGFFGDASRQVFSFISNAVNMLFELPVKMLGFFNNFFKFIFQLPRIFMKIPEKGMEVVLNLTTQFDSMLG